LIASQLMPLWKEMESTGIPFLLHKGMPLAFHYYSNPGLRPFSDVDVLIRYEDISNAMSLFKQNDFKLMFKYEEATIFKIRHALTFVSPQGSRLDMHWRPLYRSWDRYAPLDIWNELESFTFEAQVLPTAHTSFHFFQTCAHGSDWNSIASVRWAADAAVILQRFSSAIDWDWIVRQAEKHRLSVILRRQLSYLQTELELGIPLKVIEDLGKLKRWRWESVEANISRRPKNLMYKFLGIWFSHRRHQPSDPLWKACLTFPQFLLDTLNIQRKGLVRSVISRARRWV